MQQNEDSQAPLMGTWRQIIPNLFTLGAMLAGFLSILMTIQGMQSDNPEMFRNAALLIMLSMILDGFDGNVARWLNGTTAFGAELDTYVDLTAFGIAPAVLIYAVTLKPETPLWIRVMLPSAVALSGMVRLARFKVKDPLRGQGGYAGLPITANATWVAMLVFICQTPPLNQFSLSHGKVAVLFLIGIITFISLQVTSFRYPKPTKNVLMFSLCVLLVASLLVLGWLSPKAGSRVAITILCGGLVYIILGPLFVKGKELHQARKDARNQLENGEE